MNKYPRRRKYASLSFVLLLDICLPLDAQEKLLHPPVFSHFFLHFEGESVGVTSIGVVDPLRCNPCSRHSGPPASVVFVVVRDLRLRRIAMISHVGFNISLGMAKGMLEKGCTVLGTNTIEVIDSPLATAVFLQRLFS